MGLCGGDSSNYNPSEEMLATISREQFDLGSGIARPMIDSLVKELSPESDAKYIGQAEDTVGQSFDTTRGVMRRNAQRYGLSLSPQERGKAQRTDSISEALATTSAKNMTRGRLDERKKAIMQGLMGIGKGASSTAFQGLSSAAQITANRNTANAQNSASNTAGLMQAAGTGIGLAAAGFL